jgi:predicted AAA+ superfamily ATPase
MSFIEFLEAVGENKFITTLETLVDEALTNSNARGAVPFHPTLWELWKTYLVTGGLPEVVATFVEHKGSLPHALSLVRAKQEDLLRAYLADVAKHSGKVNSMHIERVLQNIPNQMLADIDASASKFQFKDVVPGVHNFSRLAPAIDWLARAGLALPVPIAHKAEQPLSAFTKENAFKLFLFDVGMLGSIAFLSPAIILNYDFGTYKGFFAENFAVQELRTNGIYPIHNWREGSAEVEFLVTTQSGDLLPIEVKSGHRTHIKSLKVFMQKYRPPRSIIFSGNEVCSNNSGLIRLPIYTAGLVAKALAEHAPG